MGILKVFTVCMMTIKGDDEIWYVDFGVFAYICKDRIYFVVYESRVDVGYVILGDNVYLLIVGVGNVNISVISDRSFKL